ncbi:MAG: lipase [Leptospiraceae bacterium]|nr:lipase [Leptospiraceae bacterium]
MKTKFFSLLLAVMLLPAGLFAQTKPLSGMCIVLVHGILGFDDTQGLAGGLVKYWGGLDTYLRNQGAKVATPGSSAANSLTVRASQTKTFLDSWMPANGCSKIHLIGHSQGGLVIRYLTTNLGYASKVSTVTSVNSLHNGAPMADIVLSVIPSWLQPFANVTLGLLAQLVYRDGRPQDVIAMGKSLTVSYSRSLSNSTPNVAGIKYYSYGSQMAWADPIQHPLMALTYPITWAGGLFYGMGTGNDGVVPFSSQRWGTWKGSPSAYWYATGIDHLQATNFSWTGQNFFDVNGWYLSIAQNAKAGL